MCPWASHRAGNADPQRDAVKSLLHYSTCSIRDVGKWTHKNVISMFQSHRGWRGPRAKCFAVWSHPACTTASLLLSLQPSAGRLPPPVRAAKKPLLLLTALLPTWSWAARCEGSSPGAPAGRNSFLGLCTMCVPQQVPVGQALAPSPFVEGGRALWRSLLPHQHVEFGLKCHHRVCWLVFLLIKPHRNDSASLDFSFEGHPLQWSSFEEPDFVLPPQWETETAVVFHGMWIAVRKFTWTCSAGCFMAPQPTASLQNTFCMKWWCKFFLSWNSAELSSWLCKCVGVLQCGLSPRGEM